MLRRSFDHLVVELSVACGRVVPRYALWLRLKELGWDPDALPDEAAIAFCDDHLRPFLADAGLSASDRALRRLRRAVTRFDASHPSPYETMERLGARRA